MPQKAMVLTTAQLVTSAQEAIVEGRLGIQRDAVEPLFVDEDGTVCAIGAAFPRSVLLDILRAGHERSNWLDLSWAGYVTYDTLDTVEAVGFLQRGHDADGARDDHSCERFCRRFFSIDPCAARVGRLVDDVRSDQHVIDDHLLPRRGCTARAAGIDAGRG